jgi:hypothetical protein
VPVVEERDADRVRKEAMLVELTDDLRLVAEHLNCAAARRSA